MFKLFKGKKENSKLSLRETQKQYEESFKKQPNVPSSNVTVGKTQKQSLIKQTSKFSSSNTLHSNPLEEEKKPTGGDLTTRRLKKQELMEMFQLTIDPKKSGLVSAQELKHILRTLGNALSAEEVIIVDRFSNKDGNVKYEDLLNEIVFL